MSIVCLGEALVDLICPRRLAPGETADRFEVHAGGALANAAVAVARTGAPVELAGGVGADDFGELLRERLAAEGVGLGRLLTTPDAPTPFAFVRIAEGGEPSFDIHANGLDAGFLELAGREGEMLEGAEALMVGSNTLLADPARAITTGAIEAARERGIRVLFDPNLRPGRWRDRDAAREVCLGVIEGASLTKANLGEVRWLVDDPGLDAAAAADALVGLGSELGVVSDGPREACARGLADARATPPPVSDPWPLGAGDALMGTLCGLLSLGGWRAESVAGALEAAVASAAAACATPGALG